MKELFDHEHKKYRNSLIAKGRNYNKSTFEFKFNFVLILLQELMIQSPIAVKFCVSRKILWQPQCRVAYTLCVASSYDHAGAAPFLNIETT